MTHWNWDFSDIAVKASSHTSHSWQRRTLLVAKQLFSFSFQHQQPALPKSRESEQNTLLQQHENMESSLEYKNLLHQYEINY